MTCLSLKLAKYFNTFQKKKKKKRFNSKDGREKTSYPGISAKGYQQKYEMQVASKKVYWKNNSAVKKPATYHH